MDLPGDHDRDSGEVRIDGLPIPLIIVSSDHGVHRIEAVSSGFAELFSSTPEHILADHADEPILAVSESERGNALSVLEYALMYPGNICVGTFHLTGSFHWPGGERLVRCSVQSMKTGEGCWRSYASFSPVPVGQGITDEDRPRDLTERMLEEQVLSKLSTLGYEIVGMIFIKEGETHYFRMKKMHLGLEFGEVEDYRESIEGDLDKVVAEEDREDVKRSLALEHVIEELEHAELYSYPFSMTTRDGRHLRKLLQFTYMDETRDTIFICRTDITGQYRNEIDSMERLREAKVSAEQANEAKSTFLASVSHDLRTPLNGIIGFTDLAIRADDMDRKQSYLAKVKSSSTLLLDLVNDTLDLSRIESGKLALEPSAVSLRRSIETVLTSLGPSAEIKGIRLVIELWDGPDRAVWMDQLKFQKILLNLLSNAIKYTAAGGTVRVEATVSDMDGDDTGKRCLCRFAVIDNGIGIAEDFLPHIFDAFAQERRPGTEGVMGTGLGLAIVKRLVKLMDGSIEVTSESGKGSSFRVSLPLDRIDASKIPGEADVAVPHVLAGTRMLICEDNRLNTEILRAILEEERAQIVCADDGAEGLRCFSASQTGEFRAILMDVHMPVMDGIEATRRIRALERSDAKDIPIVALTGDVFDADLRNCKQAGMSEVLAKPVDRAHLIAVLSALISGGQPS